MALSVQVNLETLVVRKGNIVALLDGHGDDTDWFEPDDTLFLEIVSNSAAIDTQPVSLVAIASWFIQDPQ